MSSNTQHFHALKIFEFQEARLNLIEANISNLINGQKDIKKMISLLSQSLGVLDLTPINGVNHDENKLDPSNDPAINT